MDHGLARLRHAQAGVGLGLDLIGEAATTIYGVAVLIEERQCDELQEIVLGGSCWVTAENPRCWRFACVKDGMDVGRCGVEQKVHLLGGR